MTVLFWFKNLFCLFFNFFFKKTHSKIIIIIIINNWLSQFIHSKQSRLVSKDYIYSNKKSAMLVIFYYSY
jgi:hypothetical protein